MIAQARRSHPPALRRLVERAFLDHMLAAKGEKVLVAVSGGPDSSALLHVLGMLRDKFGIELVAHGVDHGLRIEAPAELELARKLAERIGVPFATSKVDVGPGGNLQERARNARLEALENAAAAAGARTIATGHTSDDRAETVLMRLLRGAGPRGLAALPPLAKSPRGASLIRPLILARRVDVLAHLSRHRVEYATDPSNEDPRFLRVRVRRELLPVLTDLSPRIVEHLSALADMLAREPADPYADLGRAQRLAIARAEHLGRESIRLRLRGSTAPGAIEAHADSESADDEADDEGG